MPYVVVAVRGGYKVKKDVPGGQYFSKKPLTKEMATRQMKALYLSERKK
jgi:hypothetical protein